MPKAKKRVTKKAYKARKGRRYQSHTQTEGTSFIGAGRATVTKPDLPMVPFRNTGLITPPPLMQLPTNWQRMSQMGIPASMFPNNPMQLVQVEPKTEEQKLAEQQQQVAQAGNAMRAAAREVIADEKKKTDIIEKYAESVGVDPNLPGGAAELIAAAVANQERRVLNAIAPDLPVGNIPDVVASQPNAAVQDLTQVFGGLGIYDPDEADLLNLFQTPAPTAESPDDRKYAESPTSSSTPAVGKPGFNQGPVVVPIPIPSQRGPSALAAPSPYWNSAAAKVFRGRPAKSNYEPTTPTAGDLPTLFQTPLTPAPQRVLSPAPITPLATTTSKRAPTSALGQIIASSLQESFSPATDQVKEIKEKLNLTPVQQQVFQSHKPEVQRLRLSLTAAMNRRSEAFKSLLASRGTKNEQAAAANYKMEQDFVNELQRQYKNATLKQMNATRNRT